MSKPVNVALCDGSSFVLLEQDVPLTFDQHVLIARNYQSDVVRANAAEDEHVLVSDHGMVVFLSRSELHGDGIAVCVAASSSPSVHQEVQCIRGCDRAARDIFVFSTREEGKKAWDTMRRNGWVRLPHPINHTKLIKVDQYETIVRNLESLYPLNPCDAWYMDDGVLIHLRPNHSTRTVSVQMSNYSNYQNCSLFGCVTLKRGIHEQTTMTQEFLRDISTTTTLGTGKLMNWDLVLS